MSDEINVLSRTQVIFVEPSSGAISVINAGPQGPAGPGGGGGGDSLWEEVVGILQPIDPPSGFLVTTPGDINFISDDAFRISPSTPGSGQVLIETDNFAVIKAELVNFGSIGNEVMSFNVFSNGSAGITLEGQKVQITSTGALTDIRLDSNEDIELRADDTTLVQGANIVQIITTNGAGSGIQINSAQNLSMIASGTGQLSSSGNLSLASSTGSLLMSSNGLITIGVGGLEEVRINANQSTPGTVLPNGSVLMWLDETNNKLMFKIKTNGAVDKVAELAMT